MSKDTELFYKNKPIFDLAGDVKEICKPFFSQLGLNYFDYFRFYPDNTFVGLASNGAWVEHFFKRRYTMGSTLKNSGIHLWSAYQSVEAVKEAREYYSHDFGVSMFNQTPEYIEYFDFATDSNNRQIISTYYNTDVLQKCAEYFKEKAMPLINKACANPIIIPGTMQGNLISEKDFISNHFTSLTPQQLQCAIYLVKGFTFKEIAKILKLSPRTVGHYIENIKDRYQCSKKHELISFLLKLDSVKTRI
jgi:DNA-binding CsgD family transcriptional regulator